MELRRGGVSVGRGEAGGGARLIASHIRFVSGRSLMLRQLELRGDGMRRCVGVHAIPCREFVTRAQADGLFQALCAMPPFRGVACQPVEVFEKKRSTPFFLPAALARLGAGALGAGC